MSHLTTWWNYNGKSGKVGVPLSQHIQQSCVTLHTKSLLTSDVQQHIIVVIYYFDRSPIYR